MPVAPKKSQLSEHFLKIAVSLFLPMGMFHWLFPFISKTTMGNDYQSFALHKQMDLMFSISNGTFPLFIPGYCIGVHSSSLPLGQLFHPQSYLAILTPGYWAGNALEIVTA